MKSKRNLLIVLGLLFGFLAGIIVGIMLTNPGLSLKEAAGTIGKVDKYRNVKITEADIELQNELLADVELRQAFINYMKYEYAAGIKMAEDIRFGVSVANNTTEFLARNQKMIENLEQYAVLLDNSRLYLIQAALTVEEMDSKEKIALTSVVNNANNALIQIRQGNIAAYDFLTGAEHFLDEGERGTFPDLENAYLRIFNNLLASSVVSNNRMALEYLVSKNRAYDRTSATTLNSEALQSIVFLDADKLGLENVQQLGLFGNTEQLSNLLGDVQNLGMIILNTETLGLSDAESLGIDFPIIAAYDAEKLASFGDAQNLGLIIFNTEELHSFLQNIEKLQDSQIFDVERLGSLFLLSQDELNLIY